MAGTPEEIEMEANVSNDMENKSITKRKIAEEEEEEDDDLISNTPPFASVKASEKMAGTPEEIEMEANVSIDMENKSITKRKIAEEEEEDDDDLISNTPPFASVKASEKMAGTPEEIEMEANVSIDMENKRITKWKIAEEEDDDLISNTPPFASVKASEKMAGTSREIGMETRVSFENIVSSITAKFGTLSGMLSECCIYRVPWRLSKVNEEAYTPHLISIGPFHRGKKHLQSLEEHKFRYLKDFLGRTGKTLTYLLETIHMREQEARDYYSETIHLRSNEFIKMILMDGSFIVEFLLKYSRGHLLFDKPRLVEILLSDMMLIENQLPFFVLDDFYKLAVSEEEVIPLSVHFHKCFCKLFETLYTPVLISPPKIKHLVDFIRHVYLSPIPESRLEIQRGKYELSPTVTQLHKAGIKFRKGRSSSLFDIKFRDGILEIPQLNIHDLTGSLFKNLIAFEQCHRIWGHKCIFCDYFSLLDGMIDTAEDVNLLIHSEIITSRPGSSEEVSILFNNIGKDVRIDSNNFYFSSLCGKLKAYSNSPRHKWIATLRHDYFSTPWSGISVFAAVFLILLTLIQTVCSIISLYKTFNP